MILRKYIQIKENQALDCGLEKEAVKKILIDLFYQNYTEYLNNLNKEIDESKFDEYIDMYLLKKKPAQYITGFTYFFNLKLLVNDNVLIPRPETELLVEEVLKKINQKKYRTILEIGTGSGAIAIAIKYKMTDIAITATDICIKALEIAQNNAIINGVDINFIQSDVYENVKDKFDIIVSNPPYIPYEEKDRVWDIVMNNEPHLALFASDKGLYYYKKIMSEAHLYLSPHGSLIFEIGYNQATAITEFAQSIWPECQCVVIRDYNALDRIIMIDL